MNRRRLVLGAAAALGSAPLASPWLAAAKAKGLMLMSRVGPTRSQLFIAKADGSGERRALPTPTFDYHAAFAPDGRTIVFTSERRGRGQADIFMAARDGSAVRPVIPSPAVDDAAQVSPDGRRIAFVSSRSGRANVWVFDLHTGRAVSVTGRPGIQGDPAKPNGFFRPSWSPDGRWLAFSSDRNTAWLGHSCAAAQGSTSCAGGSGEGWENVQQLSVYIARPDGSGLRQIAGRPGFSTGSPKWSADGKRVVFYETPVIDTWNGRIARLTAQATSQIVSVDVASGERVEHTSGPGLKLYPQFLGADAIGYAMKGAEEGLRYTSGPPAVKGPLRAPSWSPDGAEVIYEKLGFDALPVGSPLYSWDPHYDYRSADSFPQLSRDGKVVITEQALNSSLAIMNPDGSDRHRVFNTHGQGLAFGPSWSADGQWIVFGYGLYFEARFKAPTKIMRVRRDGSGVETLYEGAQNAGFPSCSPDGRHIVFRLMGADGKGGLYILDLTTRQAAPLTQEYDNLPDWSPDGRAIVFTRRLADGNFDIFTIRPDGSGLRRLTFSGANDAHGVWTADGRILWNSGANGFKDEAPLYDDNYQPYGQIWIMNADGSGKRILTDSLWEDSQPLYAPARSV